MSRRRVWELGGAAALLLAMGSVIFGALGWRNHVRALNRELMEALDHNDARAVADLAGKGADLRTRSPYRTTAMMVAASNGDLSLLERCRTSGLRVDAANESGLTPLIFAVVHHRKDSMRWLLAHGADPNQGPGGATPLDLAADSGDLDAARILLAAGVRVNQGLRVNGRTPLTHAVVRGRLEMVRLLLRAGADPTIRDADGRTALDAARYSGPGAVGTAIRAALKLGASGAAGKR